VVSGVALDRLPNREALEQKVNRVEPSATMTLGTMQVVAGAETALHLKRVWVGIGSLKGAARG
jgi:hypothetical protein